MILVGDSNEFLLKKSVTDTHCNRLVNHRTFSLIKIMLVQEKIGVAKRE